MLDGFLLFTVQTPMVKGEKNVGYRQHFEPKTS